MLLQYTYSNETFVLEVKNPTSATAAATAALEIQTFFPKHNTSNNGMHRTRKTFFIHNFTSSVQKKKKIIDKSIDLQNTWVQSEGYLLQDCQN